MLALAVACEVIGSSALAAAVDHPVFYVLAVAGLAAAGVLLAVMLRAGLNLGVVYGIWSAAAVGLTYLASTLLYGEPVGPRAVIGLVLLAGGVLLIEIGSQKGDVHATQKEEPR